MSFSCNSPTLMGSPRSRTRQISLGNLKPRSPLLTESRRTSALATGSHFQPVPSSPTLNFRSGNSYSSSLASSSALSREWNRSGRLDDHEGGGGDDVASNYSPSASSIAPSPGTRIRAMVHVRAQIKSVPHLCGASFALVNTIFDALASGKEGASSDSLSKAVTTSLKQHAANQEGKMAGEQLVVPPIGAKSQSQLGREVPIEFHDHDHDHDYSPTPPPTPTTPSVAKQDKVAEGLTNKIYVVQLATLVCVVQGVATKHLADDSLGTFDKMFLTQLLCETYKLKADVHFGELVSIVTAANGVVVNMAKMHNHQSQQQQQWNCESVLSLLLANAQRDEQA